MRRWLLPAVAAVVFAGSAACSSSSNSTPPPRVTSSKAQHIAATLSADQPCGRTQTAPKYAHVVWIWMENKRFDAVISSGDAPFENAIAKLCGVAMDYHGIMHPSLPNYLAATGGSTFGVTTDDEPPKNTVNAPSLFAQIDGAGKSWRSYEEAMPAPCATSSSGLYGVKHNPAVFYLPLRPSCQQNDVPLEPALTRDIDAGALPSFSFITPNMCNDSHNDGCPVATGDAWLHTWVPRILGGPNYQAGDTVVVITWDESHDDPNNHIPTIVIAPSVPRGAQVQANLDHYSLLRMAEDLLGLPPLGKAADSPGMAKAFGL